MLPSHSDLNLTKKERQSTQYNSMYLNRNIDKAKDFLKNINEYQKRIKIQKQSSMIFGIIYNDILIQIEYRKNRRKSIITNKKYMTTFMTQKYHSQFKIDYIIINIFQVKIFDLMTLHLSVVIISGIILPYMVHIGMLFTKYLIQCWRNNKITRVILRLITRRMHQSRLRYYYFK